MKIKDVISKLKKLENEKDFTLGQIVDVLSGIEVKTTETKKEWSKINDEELNDDFNPDEYLSEPEKLYKEVEKRIAAMKPGEISQNIKSFWLSESGFKLSFNENMKLVPDRRSQFHLDEEFFLEYEQMNKDENYPEVCPGGLVTVLMIYDAMKDDYLLSNGKEPPEDWEVSRLSRILELKKVAFNNKN